MSAEVSDADDSPAEMQFSGALEIWAYHSVFSQAKDSLLNPANAIARLPDSQSIIDMRSNLRVRYDDAELLLQPRLLTEHTAGQRSGETDGSLYMSQAYLRIRPDEKVALTAGRSRLTWGPANFRSPSNPFYFDAGKNQPLRDVPGIDIVRADYSAANTQWTAAWVIDAGHLASRPDISDIALLKADIHRNGGMASAVLAARMHGEAFVGMFGQYPMSDALVMYGEYGRGSLSATSSLNLNRSAGGKTSSSSATTALLGASYTLLNGQMLAAEYLFDGHGMRSEEQTRYFASVGNAARVFRSAADVAMRAESAAELGRLLSNAPAMLGRHYAYLLWQSNPQESALYWRMALAANVQDGSTQALLFAEKNIASRISVFGSATINHGRADTEYGSLVSHVISVGAKFFLI